MDYPKTVAVATFAAFWVVQRRTLLLREIFLHKTTGFTTSVRCSTVVFVIAAASLREFIFTQNGGSGVRQFRKDGDHRQFLLSAIYSRWRAAWITQKTVAVTRHRFWVVQRLPFVAGGIFTQNGGFATTTVARQFAAASLRELYFYK